MNNNSMAIFALANIVADAWGGNAYLNNNGIHNIKYNPGSDYYEVHFKDGTSRPTADCLDDLDFANTLAVAILKRKETNASFRSKVEAYINSLKY